MKAATNYIFGLILLVMLPVFTVSAKKANTSAYLFVYFTGNRVINLPVFHPAIEARKKTSILLTRTNDIISA